MGFDGTCLETYLRGTFQGKSTKEISLVVVDSYGNFPKLSKSQCHSFHATAFFKILFYSFAN